MRILAAMLASGLLLAFSASTPAQTIEGRWKLVAAEDLRADGSVARYPWGQHPVGWIVVDHGYLFLQIMSTDPPAFSSADQPISEQMKAAQIRNYIAYSGPCTFDDTAGTINMKIEAGWRQDYPGSEQKRFYHFENGKLIFGTAPNSIHTPTETFTRRLTLERL
jgi:hypothetical protein